MFTDHFDAVCTGSHDRHAICRSSRERACADHFSGEPQSDWVSKATYVAGSSPPLIETNTKPTQMSLPFADCPFQASNTSKYDPLFDELHNIQTQMQDDTARLKFISDRLHKIGKQNYYPMPLAETNAAY